MTYDDIKAVVKANNKSRVFSDEFVVCLIWKESNFLPDVKNSQTSATGLMQIEESAVEMTNKNTPVEVHFDHSEMTDPAKNIQCGTYYLDIANNKMSGIDRAFGTGPGYSNNIRQCEALMLKDDVHFMHALHKIHK